MRETMVFYAYEKIKNELARQREQRERSQRKRIVYATVDLTLAKIAESSDISIVELKKAVIADVEESERIRNQILR